MAIAEMLKGILLGAIAIMQTHLDQNSKCLTLLPQGLRSLRTDLEMSRKENTGIRKIRNLCIDA